MKRYWLDTIALGLFLGVVFTFFSPTFLWGKLPVPSDTLVGLYHPWRDLYAQTNPRGIPFKNFLTTDPMRQQIPWRKVAIEAWKNGNIPRWNPYSFSGAPLDANIQAGVFYPFNILFLFLPFSVAWTALIFIEPLLSGLFCYLYLRHLRIREKGAFLGASIWSFCGFSIAWLTWGTIVHTSLWLPLILLVIDEIVSTKQPLWRFSVRKTTLLGIFFSMTILGGHIQVALYVLILSFIYGIQKLYSVKSADKRYRSITIFFSACVIALIVTSIQWIPVVRFFFQTSRISDGSLWRQPGWFLPWKHVVQFIVPDFFGNPTTLNYWGEWNYGEFIGYIGIIPLIFVLYASMTWWRQNKFWLTILFVTLLFMLPTPVGRLPYRFQIPIISALQPTRLMVIVDFCLMLLATIGFNRWEEQRDKRIWMPMVILGLIFIVLWTLVSTSTIWNSALNDHFFVSRKNLVLPTLFFCLAVSLLFLYNRFNKHRLVRYIVAVILVSLSLVDVLRFGWKFVPFTPSAYFFPSTHVINFLSRQKGLFRIASLDAKIMPPNVSAYYGLESIEGYDPLYSKRYEEYIAAMERGKPDINPPFGFNRIITPHAIDSPLFPMLNVRYILSLTELNKPYVKQVFQEGITRVYEDTRSIPRAHFVSTTVLFSHKEDILNALYQSTFNASIMAVTESPLSLPNDTLKPAEAIETVGYTPSSLRITVHAEAVRLLVIDNMYLPGWSATIDGIPVPIYRVNYLFQGLRVSAGDHTISLIYR